MQTRPSYRFCQITFSRSRKLHHRFTCVARSPEEITRIPVFVVERDEFDSQLGETRSAIIYPDRRYGEIHQGIVRHLAPHSAPAFNVVAEFHSSTDKKSIALERADDSGWVVLKNRNIHQFNYLFSNPEAFVSRATVIERLDRKGLSDRWLDELPRLVFRDIARNDDERTLIACLAPPGFASSYDTPMAVPANSADDLAIQLALYSGAFNSFVFDFVIRPYIDKHVKGYALNRVPWPLTDRVYQLSGLPVTWFASRVVEICYLTDEMKPFARDCGYNGPPFRWDDERRFLIRCELDAAYFHLCGITRDDVDYILETFPIVKRKDETQFGEYRTKRMILDIYDAMATAIRQGFTYPTRLDPPPGL